MQSLIALMANNKKQAAVLATLTAVFTTCVAFLFNHYASEDSRYATIRELATKIEEQQAEYERAAHMCALHDTLVSEFGDWTKSIAVQYTDETLAQAILASRTKRVIDEFLQMQMSMQRTRAEVAAVYFEIATLKDVQSKLLMDLDQLDTFLATRVGFLRAILADFPTARTQAEILRYNMDGRRYVAESKARYKSVTVIMERARRCHNDEVAKANASLANNRLQGKLAVAAGGYVGAFVGGVTGWALSRRRRRKHTKPQ